MDLENQKRIKEAAEKFGNENLVVLLGAAEAEAAGLAAETVTVGDPTFAGPLAGVELNLAVYHIVEEEIKSQIDEEIYEDQVGMMEMVLEVDEERRRISLGLKQCKSNPWTQFAETHNKGDKVTGKIKSITDFGIFIGLEGGIDGLVHLSDISWNVAGEEAVRNYKKGDEVSAVVLAVDAVKERISLGIKQLEDDPFNNFVAVNKKGAVISATVVEADAKGAKVELAGGVEGYIRAADLTNEVAVGDVVEAKYTGVDRKARIVHLSVKAKDQAEEAAAVANVNNKQEDVAIPNAMAEAFKAAKGE